MQTLQGRVRVRTPALFDMDRVRLILYGGVGRKVFPPQSWTGKPRSGFAGLAVADQKHRAGSVTAHLFGHAAQNQISHGA